ncbi:MAG: hypothetical protein JW862_03530 [Anaerolineales bacterium]|nr:hypothetical protein [Anaerolineales bacterium]
MKNTFRKRIWRAVLIYTLLAVLLTGCSGVADRLWLRSAGWGRAEFIGTTANSDGVPMVVAGDCIYMFLASNAEEVVHPQVLALDRTGAVVWETTLDEPLSQVSDLSLLQQASSLHLFWRNSRKLYTAVLDTSGEVVQAATLLSGDAVVDSYSAALSPDGEIALWYALERRDPSLYNLTLDGTSVESVLVDAEGVVPTLRFDQQGNLHAVWAHHPPGYEHPFFFYAYYPGGKFEPDREVTIQELTTSPTTQISGPWMGIDAESVYVFWSIAIRTGMSAGSVNTQYISFPLEAGANTPEVNFSVPDEYDLPYDEFPGADFLAGERFVFGEERYPGKSGLNNVSTNPTQAGELAVGFDTSIKYRFRKSRNQVGVGYFADGTPTSYQLLSFTSTESRAPMLQNGTDNYLYLTWLERGAASGFLVYFASTAPDIQQALGNVRSQDVFIIIGDAIFGMLIGFVLSPFAAAIWMILPVLLIVVTGKLRPGHHLAIGKISTLVTLGLAVFVFWYTKYATLGGVEFFVPFSPWIPHIPEAWFLPLQIGVPVLILLVSFLLAWNYTYRQNSESALIFILIYIAVDAALTMSLYGMLIYDAI